MKFQISLSKLIRFFLKIESLKNITDLYENGIICINSIKFFKQIEDNKLRGDNYEGASKIINSLSGTLESLEVTVILNTKKFI